ncbi:MAG: hypothetical protein AAFO51_00220 [Pseudomonadota bacterium]
MSKQLSSGAKALILWSALVGLASLARAAALLASLGAWLTRAEHTAIARQVRAAEALARRLALLMTKDMDTAPRPRAPRRADAHGGCAVPSRHAVTMFDPWRARPQPDWATLNTAANPDRRITARRLLERARAVQAVLDNPERLARRMAAWMRRRAEVVAKPITERSRPVWAYIIRPGRLPCGVAHLERSARSALRDLQSAGRAVLVPG